MLFAVGALLTGLTAVDVRLTDVHIGVTPNRLEVFGPLVAVGVVYAIYTRLLNILEHGQSLGLLRSALGEAAREE